MTITPYSLEKIAGITGGKVISSGTGEHLFTELLIDSRRLTNPAQSLFVALVTPRNDGHRYIEDLIGRGVRNFLVASLPATHEELQGAGFVVVPDTLKALQQVAIFHRAQFTLPVLGITGSNGKTIIKEWLFQLMQKEHSIIRSPKSYNSQVGVPLSVWKLGSENDLAIFEAGISQPGEMEKLEAIIRPALGLFTNIGHAHDENFSSAGQKISEKFRLFKNVRTLFCCTDHKDIYKTAMESGIPQLFTWGRTGKPDLKITGIIKSGNDTKITGDFGGNLQSIRIPFYDDASIENAFHCWAVMLYFGYSPEVIRERMELLQPVAMRLELKEAINRCSLINDSYNADINSLCIALDFLDQQKQHPKKTVILSDILQSGLNRDELYSEIAQVLASKGVDRLIGIGPDISGQSGKFTMDKAFYRSTDEFIAHFPLSGFQNESILLKGARVFEFEKISSLLEQRSHETVLEINLDALVHNLNHYRSKLHPGVMTMAMVKAFSYGSGSFEIANVLQYHRVDYLAVAYADEGVELRRAGITLPILVMAPEESSFDLLLEYNLEPEIYSLRVLDLLENAIERNQTSIQENIRVHIKLDTGMRRLGFGPGDMDTLAQRLKTNGRLYVRSIFTHLAASEDPGEDRFTARQVKTFREMNGILTGILPDKPLLHVLNSAGVTRFPEYQFDMVRLGIGLYGVGADPEEQALLRNVSTLRSMVSQVREVKKGETVGYNRKGKVKEDTILATVSIGYADGLDRRLGNGKGSLLIKGKPAKIIGNICMDLCMVDVSEHIRKGLDIREGDEVIIFGEEYPVTRLAEDMGTIPYEIFTSVSRRVKRVYFHE